jgi:hypothetical protein
MIWVWVILLAVIFGASYWAARQNEPGEFVLESHSASTTHTETITLTGDGVPTLQIIGAAGSVMIRAGEPADQLVVEYTKTAYGESDKDAREELDDVTIHLDQDGSRVSIDTRQPKTKSVQRANTVNLVLTVPPTISLDVFVATGAVTIEGVRAPDQFKVVNMSGSVTIQGVDASDGMSIEAKAGNLSFAGAVGAAGEYTLTAAIGDLTVTLPPDTSARLDAQVMLGTITVSGLEVADRVNEQPGAGATLRGVLGQGGPTLTLRNQMGNITLKGSYGDTP